MRCCCYEQEYPGIEVFLQDNRAALIELPPLPVAAAPSSPFQGAPSSSLGNQNVLASSILSTVMENSAASGAGNSPPNSVFSSKYEIHTDPEKKAKDHLESILEEPSQKGRDVQKRLNEATELHEQQKINSRLITADLQSKPMEVQLERATLRDSRQKESQSQENVKARLQNTIQELEAANQLQEELLREADRQSEHLRRTVHSQEEVLLELRGILMGYRDSTGKKLYEHENIPSLQIHSLSRALAGVLRELDSEVSYLKEKVVLVEGELETLKKDSQTQKQLLLQQPHNSEQTGNRNSLRAPRVTHLESTVSQLHSESREAKKMCGDKVGDLEKQLHVAHSEKAEAQTEQDHCSQESGNLNEQIHQLLAELRKKEMELSLEKEQKQRCWDRNTEDSITIDHLRRELANKNMQLQHMENRVQEARTECHRHMERQMMAVKEKNESIGRISSLTVQLESTKDTLLKVKEDLTAKQINLETAEKTASNLRACLQEKERALEVTDEEIQRLHSQLGRRMQELQHLRSGEDRLHGVQSECEALKLQVLEKGRIAEIFQKQIDTMAQIVGQHSRTARAMEVEKAQLIKEINGWKLQVEELKIAKDEKGARIQEVESRLSELELEKVKLVNTCTKRLRALDDMKLEKNQLLNEVQASRSELAGLAEGFEDLKREYQDKIREMENTASRLKMQLKSAQAELEQTRTALKTMEGSDGNAVKVAVGMQKKITAKRGQIDALHSKIQFLEEAMTNAAKEKHYLREENSKLSQELSCVTAENSRIAGELEILRSQDKHLKGKISKMETALDKAAVQVAECQRMIQRQEQEVVRFRLQHTLDVKELQGPGHSSASAPGKLRHVVPLAHPHPAVVLPALNSASHGPPGTTCHFPGMPSKPGILKEEPLEDLKRIHRARDRDPATESIVEKAALGRDPSSCSHTADLQSQDITLPFSSLGGASVCSAAPPSTSSHKKLSREQRYRERSPVHVLLTSPPDDLAATRSTSPAHRPSPRKADSPEAAATAHQITMSSTTGTQERKMEKAKGKEKKLSK